MSKSLIRLAILSAPLLLSACGEGWEMQKTDTMFPYGNQRTAGTGVVYVLAKMLPKKELKIEPIIAEEKVKVEPVLDAEEIFTEAQVKGRAPAPKKVKKEHSSNAIKETPIETISNAKLTAEEYISQEPKEIKNAASVVPKEISEVEPSAGSASYITIGELDTAYGQGLDENEIIEIYENKVSQPLKQIVVPKQDFLDLRTKGEASIDEIYNDAFISSF